MQKRDVSFRSFALALCAGLLLSASSAGSARADNDECAYFDPFMELCCKGTAEQVREAARQGARVNMRVESEEGGRGALTPLIAAAGNDNRPVVRALLDAGADLNASLMEAARNADVPETRQSRLLRVLLAEGPNVNGRDDDGNTPLLVAALPMTVRMLLAAGAEVNVRNKAGETPLMRAAAYMDMGTIRALLEAGADVNARADDGRTALMAAASSNAHADVVASLLLAGADKGLKDAEGRDALRHARLRSTHVGPGDGDDENDPEVAAALKRERAAAEAVKAEIVRLLEGGDADKPAAKRKR